MQESCSDTSYVENSSDMELLHLFGQWLKNPWFRQLVHWPNGSTWRRKEVINSKDTVAALWKL